MISRLFLIGVVGALGISLPDGAEWGIKFTWAQTGAKACARGRDVVAFEPIAIDETPSNRLVDELNRLSEGLDIPPVPTVRIATISQRTTPKTCDVVERLFADNRVWAEPVDAVEQLFADNRVWAEPMATSRPPARETRPTFEPIAVVTTSPLVDELNRAAEGIDISAAIPAPRRPAFEPIAVVTTSSLADELNRAAEGQSFAPETDRGVGNAIRLTRNAALAWMHVLTNTMPVPITSR